MISPLLCYGEISWDIATQVDLLPHGESDSFVSRQTEGPGGCAFNTAAALAVLQDSVYLGGNCIGRDLTGVELKKAINKYSNIHQFGLNENDLQTPQCQVLIEAASGKRSFILHHRDIQVENTVSISKTRNLLESGEIQFAFLQCYLKSSVQKIFQNLDSNTILMTQDLQPEHELVSRFDYLQISYPSTESSPSIDDCREFLKPYFNNGAKQIILTCGSHGIFYCSDRYFEGGRNNSNEKNRDTFFLFQPQEERIQTIDTTGCGDTFRAGFLHALNQGKSIQECLRFGQTTASWKASVRGSCLPSDFQLQNRSRI